jgi:hypothetical protein
MQAYSAACRSTKTIPSTHEFGLDGCSSVDAPRFRIEKSVMGSGTLLPVASTGMSSYLSKLIPVVCPEKNSLRKVSGQTRRISKNKRRYAHLSKRSSRGSGTVQSAWRVSAIGCISRVHERGRLQRPGRPNPAAEPPREPPSRLSRPNPKPPPLLSSRRKESNPPGMERRTSRLDSSRDSRSEGRPKSRGASAGAVSH